MKDFKIISERLLLKIISTSYLDDIFKEFTPEVTRFLIPQPSNNKSDTLNFIIESRENSLNGKELQLVIINKNSKEFLGCIGIHNMNTKNPSLGIWIKKEAWNNGYGKEAMVALKKWADSNMNYKVIKYSSSKENIASLKIVEFLGGKITSQGIKKNLKGEPLNSIDYLISKNT